MPLSSEHTCATCGARISLLGARAFTPLPCSKCGAEFRARTEIGGYRLGKILARSGLAVIFQATDQGGAELAVKVLQPPFAAEPVDVEYFLSTVWALARLNHPNCLRIFAAGAEQGLAWIAMEWLAGGSLAARLAERGKLRESEVLAIGLQAAAALAAAEAAGHLHHDLEPRNFVFADARTVKVTDFGVAPLYLLSGNELGTMWGRASHVPPERMRGEVEEAHSDIFALGTVLFQALTGLPPNGGEASPQATLERIESEEVKLAAIVPGLHEKTAQVLDRMLASEPTQRFQQWSEVVAQLTQAATLVARRDAPGAAAPTAPAPRNPARKRRQPSSSRRQIITWTAGAVGFIALAAGLASFISKRRDSVASPPAPIHSTPAPTPRTVAAAPASTPAMKLAESPAPKATAPAATPRGPKKRPK